MPVPSGLADAVVWLEPMQAAFAVRMAASGGWRVASAGFPRSVLGSDKAREAASLLGIEAPIQDLRHTLATTEARIFVVLSAVSEEGDRPGAVAPLDDPQVMSTCRTRGIDVVTLEPSPGTLLDRAASSIAGGGGAAGAGTVGGSIVRQAPMWCRSALFTQVVEVLSVIGKPRCVAISFRCGPGEGSLAARLVDACAALVSLPGGAGGVPEIIDAAAVTPRGSAGTGVHLALPDRLRMLRGDLTANLRMPGGVAASLTLSDGAGPWERRVRIVGELGTIDATDASVHVTDPSGVVLDAEAPASRERFGTLARAGGLWGPGGPGERVSLGMPGSDAATIAGLHARMELDRRGPAEPIDWAGVLATAEAALLSARTGQNESPATLLRMAGVPG
ncbi:MAG: hypothetical protein ACKVZJ_03065 [Phycisphaerales bacterium]